MCLDARGRIIFGKLLEVEIIDLKSGYRPTGSESDISGHEVP